MNTYAGLPVSAELGTYEVSFRLASEGFYANLHSSKIVEAPSRAAAIASVATGFDAGVIVWGPEDPEPRAQQFDRILDLEQAVRNMSTIVKFHGDERQRQSLASDQAKLSAALDSLTPAEMLAFREYRRNAR